MRLLAGLTAPGMDRADAVTVAGRACSGEALLGAAGAVADDLRGVAVVAVLATPSLETVVGVVGGLLAGAAVVPIPPDSGPVERSHLLRDSGAEVLLDTVAAGDSGAGDGGAGDGGAGDGGATDTAAVGAAAGPAVLPVDIGRRSSTAHPEHDPNATALILYTSGTTGAPKGAALSRAAVAAGLDALVDAWRWTPEDVLVHGLPLFHVHGLVLGVLGALRVGCRLVHTGRPTPAGYAAAGGSLYFGVPTVWSRICAQPPAARALRGARLLVSGSAALPIPVFARLRALTGHLPVERYGMTETLITLSGRADGERRAGYVGLPVAGVETRLLAEDGGPVPSDGVSVGELHVRGPMLFDGYWRRPAAAAGRAPQGWFGTGDIATIGPDGWHRIVGRASTDLIKSGGYRIGAGEVENALLAHPAVREVAVVGRPDPDLGERVTAYVVADGVDGPDLTEFVGRQLSHHKRPRRIHFVADLPRNAMGKVQKRLLPEG
ncbi:acyl-CoA synthetase [Plantactinospora sp. KBS50]|uniref:acyl-CoA synthetase n=1 Tax=Plantactinospora sp. KBS50 TaxID=2024580 RepID=UPI000BAAD3D1|nr:acyl-CoA synthetase [Plantactinospora sp. KBS50]ASW54907.1 acyl-CoA synthetase [Plantactinospora sp. KBS50]